MANNVSFDTREEVDFVVIGSGSAGGILAKETAQGRVVTVAVDSIQFIKPVKVGDVVCCYGSITSIGTTSITIKLEDWVNPVLRDEERQGGRFKVTEATFTYVAIDNTGHKRPVYETPPTQAS